MKKTLLLLLLPALFTTGCNDNNDAIVTIGLQGAWNLVEIDNGLSDAATQFDPGVIIWNFNEASRKLIVQNNAPANSGSPLNTATYGYTIGAETNVCNEALYVEQTGYGCITISADTLTVSTGYANSNTLKFAR